jgi:hypothetical protein
MAPEVSNGAKSCEAFTALFKGNPPPPVSCCHAQSQQHASVKPVASTALDITLRLLCSF